jgi:predicted transcriptional regulator
MDKTEIKKHVVISSESAELLAQLARQIGRTRKVACEQAIGYYLEHVRGGQPDKISVRLEKLLRIFNNRLEELLQ